VKRKKYQYIIVRRPCANHIAYEGAHPSGRARRAVLCRSWRHDRYFLTASQAELATFGDRVRAPCCTAKVFRVERVL